MKRPIRSSICHLCCVSSQPEQPQQDQQGGTRPFRHSGSLLLEPLSGESGRPHSQQAAEHRHRDCLPGRLQPRANTQAGGNAVQRQHHRQQHRFPESQLAGAVGIGQDRIEVDRQYKPQIPGRECRALYCQPGSKAPEPVPGQPDGPQQDQQQGPAVCTAAFSSPRQLPARIDPPNRPPLMSPRAQSDRAGIRIPAALYASTAEKLSTEAAADIPNRSRSV